MKKLLIIVNILLLGIILIISCKEQKTAGPVNPDRRDTCNLCKSYTGQAWNGLINPALARRMSEAYAADSGKKYIWNRTVSANQLDATSITFRLETLKRFIWEIESRACQYKCNDTLGIRIYYAKYPDSARMSMESDLAGLDPTFANKHTLFMVPAHWIAAKKEYRDFSPVAMSNTDCYPPFGKRSEYELVLTLAEKQQASTSSASAGNSSSGYNQNHGGLAPPPAFAGTFDDTP